MTPRKLNLLIATFSYGGNGGIRSEVPDVRNYLCQLLLQLKQDPRIGEVHEGEFADTPLTMCRNKAVLTARQWNCDLLLMIDSDMKPDMDVGVQPEAKPFWDTSFDFLYRHYDRGPVVIGAPYCGPPPVENVYVFRWRFLQNDNPNDDALKLDQYMREEAAERSGIEQVAALPTGLILFDMRAFELTEPKVDGDKPWFFYEYTDRYETQKASTEDVTATREIAFHGQLQLGYNPIHVNWDAWAGHWKPKLVGKPRLLSQDAVSDKYTRAVHALPADKRRHYVKTSAADGEWEGVPRG
jgi:hypothetical protein